jgi:hypothetical protein
VMQRVATGGKQLRCSWQKLVWTPKRFGSPSLECQTISY